MPMKIMLVYLPEQVACVFKVDTFNLRDRDRNAKRLYEGDWKTAAALARAFRDAGAGVETVGSGNPWAKYKDSRWTDELHELPFYNEIELVHVVR
jgi:hypothetical protein